MSLLTFPISWVIQLTNRLSCSKNCCGYVNRLLTIGRAGWHAQTRMHSSRMRTACSLIVSLYLVVSHTCLPQSNHAHPPGSNHTCPPGATMHAPPGSNHACHPPGSNHTCPPEQPCMPPLGATMYATPQGATMHAPPGSNHAGSPSPGATMHAPPRSNHACPWATTHAPRATTHTTPPRATTHTPQEQPCMPPQSNHTCPPWTEGKTGVKILPSPKLRLRAVMIDLEEN